MTAENLCSFVHSPIGSSVGAEIFRALSKCPLYLERPYLYTYIYIGTCTNISVIWGKSGQVPYILLDLCLAVVLILEPWNIPGAGKCCRNPEELEQKV